MVNWSIRNLAVSTYLWLLYANLSVEIHTSGLSRDSNAPDVVTHDPDSRCQGRVLQEVLANLQCAARSFSPCDPKTHPGNPDERAEFLIHCSATSDTRVYC